MRRLQFIAALVMAALLGTIPQVRAADFIVDSDSYAAIAYSQKTGRYGYAYDYRSRWAAERAAVRHCKADDAKRVCWVNAGWCALAVGKDTECYGTGYSYGNGATHAEARKEAIADCKKRTSGVYVKVFLLSDGQLIYTVDGDDDNKSKAFRHVSN